jgi:hypothetical protein
MSKGLCFFYKTAKGEDVMVFSRQDEVTNEWVYFRRVVNKEEQISKSIYTRLKNKYFQPNKVKTK